MKHILFILIVCLAAFFVTFFLPSCESTGGPGGLYVDPIGGLCYRSADGKYSVCHNPATQGYTLKATVPGGIVKDLSYHSATDTWRTTLPDGTTAIYDADGLRFEPPLPVQ